jgi:hypothetical protein
VSLWPSRAATCLAPMPSSMRMATAELLPITRVREPEQGAPSRASELYAPKLDKSSAAVSGLPGEIVDALEPTTEADPAGILTTILVEFGSMVGEMAEMRVGPVRHPASLFAVLVGDTAWSRKDTAIRDTESVMRRAKMAGTPGTSSPFS